MSVRTEVSVLAETVRLLRASWQELVTTIMEDQPVGDGLAVADVLVEVANDGLSDVDAALAALEGKPGAAAVYQAAAALETLRRRYDERVRSYAAVSTLLSSVRDQGTEWRNWARSVVAGSVRCQEPLQAVCDALLRCWREVSEQGGKR